MTPQEHELLSTFLDNLSRARPDNKDADAEAMIRRALASQPDAAYILVQQALLQESRCATRRRESRSYKGRSARPEEAARPLPPAAFLEAPARPGRLRAGAGPIHLRRPANRLRRRNEDGLSPRLLKAR